MLPSCLRLELRWRSGVVGFGTPALASEHNCAAEEGAPTYRPPIGAKGGRVGGRLPYALDHKNECTINQTAADALMQPVLTGQGPESSNLKEGGNVGRAHP